MLFSTVRLRINPPKYRKSEVTLFSSMLGRLRISIRKYFEFIFGQLISTGDYKHRDLFYIAFFYGVTLEKLLFFLISIYNWTEDEQREICKTVAW